MIGVTTSGVKVETSNNGGHGLEFFADRLVARLIHVSDNAPEPIKAQALLFRDSMKRVVFDGLLRTLSSDRSDIILELERNGMPEAAALIRTLGKRL